MGGHALEKYGVVTRRVGADEYHNQIVPTVVSRTTTSLGVPNIGVAVVPSYAGKESFGDVDILIERDMLPGDWVQRILLEFNPSAHYKNGPVLSFDYSNFQVDLITTPTEDFDFSLKYFAYNDLGNLIGRVAKRMGFKFGQNGLSYVLRDTENDVRVIEEIVVTKNFSSALSFLGYDVSTYDDGFDTIEEVFEYVISSPFYDSRIFDLENRSRKDRVRDRKRQTYQEFLVYKNKHERSVGCLSHVTRSEHLLIAMDAFDSFGTRYHIALADHERRKKFRDYFNGNVVSGLTGLEGKELGAFMSILVASSGGKDRLMDMVLDPKPENVVSLLCELNKQT